MQRDQQDRPDLYEPQEFDQLVALLRIDEHRGKLFARISTPGKGLAVDGVGLPALPESMRDLLSFPRRTGNIMQLKRSASSFTQTEYELYGDHGVAIFIEPKTN